MSHDERPGTPPDGLPRRDFFRQGLRNILQSVAKAVGDRLERIQIPPEVFSETDTGPGGARHHDLDLAGRILRPPGALKEELFLDRCARSGECVKVCPVQAIKVHSSEDARLAGLPYIDP